MTFPAEEVVEVVVTGVVVLVLFVAVALESGVGMSVVSSCSVPCSAHLNCPGMGTS